ncbi:MAG: DUF3015 family protein [Bacteriovoracaceae bacterium]|nr:DUF3015 family protein [Bacteriovoracaceae bacterium]
MKSNFKMLIIASFCMISLTAEARNVWRECGIGGMIFTKTGWAAITSNIIWDAGTSATSSNISSEDLCEGPTASVANFVHGSYAVIEEQTVIGGGDHLVAMLDILGCEKSSHDTIIKTVRGNFTNTISQPGYESQSKLDKAKNYHTNLMNSVNKNFSTQCHVI